MILFLFFFLFSLFFSSFTDYLNILEFYFSFEIFLPFLISCYSQQAFHQFCIWMKTVLLWSYNEIWNGVNGTILFSAFSLLLFSLRLLLFGSWNFSGVCVVGQILCVFIVSGVWVLLWEARTRCPSTVWWAGWPSTTDTVGHFTEQSQTTATSTEFLEAKDSGQNECNLWNDQGFDCQENQTTQEQWNESNQFCAECQQKWAHDFLNFTTSFFDGTSYLLWCLLWEFHFQWMRFNKIGQRIHGQIKQTAAAFRFISWKWVSDFILRNCFGITSRNRWISAWKYKQKIINITNKLCSISNFDAEK